MRGVRHRGLQNFSIGGLGGGGRACLKLLLLRVLLPLRNIVHIKEWGEVKGIAKASRVTRGAALGQESRRRCDSSLARH